MRPMATEPTWIIWRPRRAPDTAPHLLLSRARHLSPGIWRAQRNQHADRTRPGHSNRPHPNRAGQDLNRRNHRPSSPLKVMKNSFRPAASRLGSAISPPLSSRLERSAVEGPAVPRSSLENVFRQSLATTRWDEKRSLFSNDPLWKRRPPLCHLDRNSEGA